MKERRKSLVGRVTSDKMDKTVVVIVERTVRHPLYGKVLKRVKKYKAHDEQNECHIGDQVRIVESRPLSREKRWRVVEIVERVA
jgi:small subunit ribosomal protein S17